MNAELKKMTNLTLKIKKNYPTIINKYLRPGNCHGKTTYKSD